MGERNYKEKVVLVGCLLGVIGFIPFTVYRYVNGDHLLAFIESCLAISILGVFYYVWKTHKYEVPAIIMSFLFMSVVIAVVHIKGPSLVYWTYPTILFCFCVLRAHTGAILSVLSMLLLFPALYPVLGNEEVILIYTTLSLLALFGYTFTMMSLQQYNELSALAARDGLTGAWNRRSLDEAISQIGSKHKRSPMTASLIIMDLDHFKKINNTYGHGAGDEILVKVAELLRRVVRVSDQLYRYGGEEFVLIAEGANLEEAKDIAETIRSRVEKSQLFDKQKVTISLGVAELSQASSPEDWLSLADKALYTAKEQGRNRFCVAPTQVFKAAA